MKYNINNATFPPKSLDIAWINMVWDTKRSKYLDDISEQEEDCMIYTIKKLYKIMWERKNHFE